MRKLLALSAMFLLFGAFGTPVSARPADSNNPVGTQPPGLSATPTELAKQSRFDGGTRQVLSGPNYCQAVGQGPAAEQAQAGEAQARRAERQDLEALHTPSGALRSGGGKALPGPRLGLEFPETWQSSQVVQQVLRELSILVDANPDLYGYEVDAGSETIAVVHRGGADVGTVQAEIQRLLDSAEAGVADQNRAVANSDLSDLGPQERAAVQQDMADQNAMILADVDVTVDFRSVCRAEAGDLDEVQAAVESFQWADDGSDEADPGNNPLDGEIHLAVQRNLVNGVVEVVVESDDAVAAEIERRLREQFGEDVEMVIDPDHALFGTEQVTDQGSVAGRRFQAGRYSDRSPHLGGVQVGDWNFRRGACTTGFAINMPGGGRAMLTAGHCKDILPVDTLLYSGVFSRRDSYNYYGTFYRSFWSDRDVGLIGSGNQTYRRMIYTDPDPSGAKERLVTAVWEPWVGAKVCMSGSFTGNICGGEVTGRFSGCFRGGSVSQCGRSYSVAGPGGRSMSQPGDSGGPVYLPHGGTSARALGIISTGLGAQTTFVGASAIQKATGGWIASSCCDADTW